MLITFEGIDGCGKTTQIRLCAQWLKEKGNKVYSSKQPGGTELGHRLRDILSNDYSFSVCAEAEMLLYLADRIQHLQEKILPALREKRIVLLDRYHDSTLAYQRYGRGLHPPWMTGIGEALREPDLTFWLDLPVEEAFNRIKSRGEEKSRIENEKISFFEKVRSGYQTLYGAYPERIKRIDATESIAEVQKAIVSYF